MKSILILATTFCLITFLQSCGWKCNGITKEDVIGYYYPIIEGESEYIYIKPDGTYLHFHASKKDTIRDMGNWDISEKQCTISLDNMRWLNSHFEEWRSPTYVLFQWENGKLKMGSDYLSYERKKRGPE